MKSLADLNAVFLLADEAVHRAVPAWETALFGVILVAMIAALALEEKIHAKKSIIVGTFAGLCLILATLMNLLTFGPVELPDHHQINLPVYIPSIDWGVITIILGASLFVEVTSRSGVFTWMAISLTRKSGGDPKSRRKPSWPGDPQGGTGNRSHSPRR